MKNNKIHDQLMQVHAYFDEELPPIEREVFFTHLKSCLDCQEELAELKFLNTSLDLLNEIKYPVDLRSNINLNNLKKSDQKTFWVGAIVPFLLSVFGFVFGWPTVWPLLESWSDSLMGIGQLPLFISEYFDSVQEYASNFMFRSIEISYPLFAGLAVVSLVVWWQSMRLFVNGQSPSNKITRS